MNQISDDDNVKSKNLEGIDKKIENTGTILEYVTEEDDGVNNVTSEENENGRPLRKNPGAVVDRLQSDFK